MEKVALSRILERRVIKRGVVPMLATVAIAGCGQENKRSGEQPPKAAIENTQTSPGSTVEAEPVADENREQADHEGEISLDFSSPEKVAWAFAEAWANGDTELACKLTPCGHPGDVLHPGTEIVPFPDDLPVGEPTIAGELEGRLVVEIQKTNSVAGKWCIEAGKDSNGNWQVLRYHNPLASDRCPSPVYDP